MFEGIVEGMLRFGGFRRFFRRGKITRLKTRKTASGPSPSSLFSFSRDCLSETVVEIRKQRETFPLAALEWVRADYFDK